MDRPSEVYPVLNNAPSVMVSCAVSKEESIWLHFFENKNMTVETYKMVLWYDAFLKFRECLEDSTFQQNSAPSHFSVLVRLYID